MSEDRSNLITQCQLSSLYHKHRECFLVTCHRMVLFVIIMSSAMLASGLVEGYATVKQLMLLSPVLLASLDLVFSFSTASQTHKFFRHRYSYIEAKLVGGDISPDTLTEMSKEVTQLMAEEPPAYRALLYHCVNLVDLRARDKPTLKIPTVHMLLRNVFRFAGSQPNRIETR